MGLWGKREIQKIGAFWQMRIDGGYGVWYDTNTGSIGEFIPAFAPAARFPGFFAALIGRNTCVNYSSDAVK